MLACVWRTALSSGEGFVCVCFWRVNLKFEAGGRAFAGFAKAAADAIAVIFEEKFKIDPHFSGANSQQAVVGASFTARFSGFSPQCPGDGVEQGGFAVSIGDRLCRRRESPKSRGGARFRR